ncbi:hydroxymethylbilane synthase [Anaerostipes sp.]|uniref:hydroxymethylbilane synthase n=1 Tax=Anaerostipes sp. TaxID=1872530 RepID=UPI0025BD1AA0|nr:hydroxymethylbilane synthase [Anaerostipes sp.]MBS7007402.1 hydroxymethylbilane synthase [Anaerostipes sp.]
MEPKRLRIGSRESLLAVAQTELVIKQLKKYYPGLTIELVTLKTTGDKILNKTLDQIGGKGLFVKELDQALLDGRIDMAVHSMKDLPMEISSELPIAAVPKRGDPRDVLVLPVTESGTDKGQVIGSSSARRVLQAKKLFPDASFQSIRGNIHTRLNKLDEGRYSALIMAAAGLCRAGLQDRISRYFSVEEMLPSAGQGTLCIQVRKDFDRSFFSCIHDRQTELVTLAERSFVRTLDGGCSSPIAAYASVTGKKLSLTGLFYDETSETYRKRSIGGNPQNAEELGRCLAKQIKSE